MFNYVNVFDTEQLYDLNIDPTEQSNGIDDITAADADTVCEFKFKMVDYITNVACPIDVCPIDARSFDAC